MKLIPEDPAILFSEQATAVQRNSTTSRAALLDGHSKSLNHVGAPGSLCVPQRKQEASRRGRRVRKISAAPSVGVKGIVGRDDKMADVSKIVGKHRRTKPRGKRKAATVAFARSWSSHNRGALGRRRA